MSLTLRVRWTITPSLSPPPTGCPLYRSAFGDAPETPLAVDAGDPPELRWLAGVVLGGRGQYGAAWAHLEPVVRSPTASGALRAHAAVTRASHLRQLGGHRQARRWDGFGLATAVGASPGGGPLGGFDAATGFGAGAGIDAAAAGIDAMLGLAADALGLGELELSARLLDRAEPLALAHPSWRPKVRLHWIRAELALSRGEPALALARAELAAALSETAGSTRHEVKSQLVWVVARSCVGEAPENVYSALEALTERAIGSRLNSLEWPIALLLGQMAGPWDAGHTPAYRARYRFLLDTIRQACDPIGRMVLNHSPWVAAAFGL